MSFIQQFKMSNPIGNSTQSSPYFSSFRQNDNQQGNQNGMLSHPPSVAKNDEVQRPSTNTFNEAFLGEMQIKIEPSSELDAKMSPYFSSNNPNQANSVPNDDTKWDKFPANDEIKAKYGDAVYNRIYESYNQLNRFVIEIKNEFGKPFEDKTTGELSGYWDTVNAIVSMQAIDAQNWRDPDNKNPVQNNGAPLLQNGNIHPSNYNPNFPIKKEEFIANSITEIKHEPGVMNPYVKDEPMTNAGPTSLEPAPKKPRAPPVKKEIALKCLHCTKQFNNMGQARPHLRMHTGIKPYRCQMCNYTTYNKTQLLSNHFQNKHGRKGTDSEMFTDLEAIGRMEGLVAQEVEKIDDNYRVLVHGAKPSVNIQAPGNLLPGAENPSNPQPVNALEMNQTLIMAPQEDEKIDEKEGEISPYFMSIFNDLNNEGDDAEENPPEDNAMDTTDVNKNAVNNLGGEIKGIAAKLGNITGAAAEYEKRTDDPEVARRLADEMNFIAERTQPAVPPGAEVEKRLASEIDSIAHGIAAQK